jgi:hypothetical protein
MMTMAEGYCERIRDNVRKTLPRVHRENYGTIYQERRIDFERPTLKESLEPLPSSLEVSRGPPPNVFIKPEELKRAYEDKVCNLLGFPHLFFKANTGNVQGSSSSQSQNKSGHVQLDFSQRQLEDVIIRQQTLFQHIYQEIYLRSFMYLDIPIFSQLPSEALPLLEHIRVRMNYNNLITKSDEAIHRLLPFYQQDIISREDIRGLLVRNFGITEEEKKDIAPSEK